MFTTRFLVIALLCSSCLAAPGNENGKEVLEQLLKRARNTDSAAMLVMHDGAVVAEYSASGGEPQPGPSVTKAVVALGVGLLLRDRKLESLDTPVHRFFPEWKQGRKQLVTVRMLLDQTSGLADEPDTGAIYASPDFVQFALAAEMGEEPGARWVYGNKATNLLPALISKASGMAAQDYFARQLFQPLGIAPADWTTDSAGNLQGMAGLKLSARDVAKLGQLVVDEGRWNGMEIIPASYIREMLDPASRKTEEYGLMWFRDPAWIHLRVDGESMEMLRALQVDSRLIRKVSKLEGRAFESPQQFIDALDSVLDRDELGALYAQLHAHDRGRYAPFHLEIGPVVAYRAEAEPGQYLCVVPAARIVAVRQVVASEGGEGDDHFDDFVERVIAYAKAIHPALDRGAR